VDHADETTSTFRMRRAEMSAKGEIIPKLVAYAVMIDPAKVLEFQDTELDVQNQDPPPSDPDAPETVTAKQPVSAVSVFQDLFITFLSEYVDASIGQFKIPVSWEGYNSSSKLLFAERAPVSREYGDKRDMGLRLAKSFQYFGYSAGLFNGTTLNNLDNNNAKDAALRLEAYPIEGMVIAGVIYGSIGDRGDPGTKDRFEGDLRYETGAFLAQAEFIRTHDVGSSGSAVDGQGFYAALAFTFMELLQPALRVGYLDPNVDVDIPETASNDEKWNFDVGLNFYIRKHEVKLQLNYSRWEYDDRTPNNEVLLAAQVAF
jgi:phosphate-selective porin